jgi:Flp pilus assembly pilin Flp
MSRLLRKLWLEEEGQDIAEYAIMVAVILVIVIGTVRLIGTKSNTVFPTSPVPFNKVTSQPSPSVAIVLRAWGPDFLPGVGSSNRLPPDEILRCAYRIGFG